MTCSLSGVHQGDRFQLIFFHIASSDVPIATSPAYWPPMGLLPLSTFLLPHLLQQDKENSGGSGAVKSWIFIPETLTLYTHSDFRPSVVKSITSNCHPKFHPSVDWGLDYQTPQTRDSARACTDSFLCYSTMHEKRMSSQVLLWDGAYDQPQHPHSSRSLELFADSQNWDTIFKDQVPSHQTQGENSQLFCITLAPSTC